MNIDQTLDAVRRAFGSYPSLFANLRACKTRDNRTITWLGQERPWLTSFPRYQDFLTIVEKSQYTFQSADGSALVQMYYEFDRRTVIRASLAYVRAEQLELMELSQFDAPEERNIEMGADIENADNLTADEIEEEEELEPPTDTAPPDQFAVSWLRVDLDREAARGLGHPACHLHVHGFPDLRVPVRGVPTPIQFVDFVVAMMYPKLYATTHLTDEGDIRDRDAFRAAHLNHFPCDDAALIDLAIHIHLPGVSRS